MLKARHRSRSPVASDRRFRNPNPGLADYGTQERWQHSGRALEPTEHAGVLAARATEEHILDILLLRGYISATDREAALKFKLDYKRACIEGRVTGGYNAASTARDFFAAVHERSDFEEAAYRRWRNALREIGLRLSSAVLATVCDDLIPTPRDLPLLQAGLKKLVDWYGLEKR